MKKIIILVSSLLLLANSIKAQQLVEVRNLFYRSVKSSVAADSLYTTLLINSKSAAEVIGYKGMGCLMICYHSYNPYTKYKYFVEGKELLEKAITNDKANIELRFLRLSVQLNTPSFLGYNSSIEEDKLFILKNASLIKDVDLFYRIYNYTCSAKKLTAKEKEIMKQALLSNKNISSK